LPKHQQTSMKITSRDVSTAGVVYDVVVAGAGPAGLTAALFAARAGLTVLVLGSSTGQLSEATALDNFPSFTGGLTKGEDWLVATKQQVASVPGVHFGQGGLLISRIEKLTSDSLFALSLDQDKYTVATRSVVVATGATGRRLGLPYEDILWGKMVHSCAICDGSSYTQKQVVVVGGGDAALDAAILLSRHAKSVIIIHRRTSFRASNQHNLQLAKNLPNVQLRTPYIVTQYETSLLENNEQQLRGVKVQHVTTGKMERIDCDGMFVMIGATPNTEFVKGSVELDAEGLILLSKTGSAITSTSVPGVFAAGEVTDSTYKQAITAASAGAQAAIDTERWLRQQPAIKIQSEGNPETTDAIPLEKFESLNNLTEQLPVKGSPTERREAKTQSSDCDLAQEDCITSLVIKYPVVVFSKPYCPYCKRAIEVLRMESVKDPPFLLVVDLTATANMGAVQDTLKKMTGRRTVPNVFVGGTSIGGGDETTALHQTGKLLSLLQSAKAFAVDDGSDECDLTLVDCVTSVVNKYPVVVFSKSYCPYCKRALEALNQEGVKDEKFLKIIDLTQITNMGAVQDTLNKMTGRRTVPNVFVGGKSIGGGDETTGLHRDGKLRPLLEEAQALG
jgi:thioredoxin reductase (NADPH)